MGTPRTGSRHFRVVSVSGRKRVPSPAANKNAFLGVDVTNASKTRFNSECRWVQNVHFFPLRLSRSMNDRLPRLGPRGNRIQKLMSRAPTDIRRSRTFFWRSRGQYSNRNPSPPAPVILPPIAPHSQAKPSFGRYGKSKSSQKYVS